MSIRLIVILVSLFIATTANSASEDYSALMLEDAAQSADSEFTGRYEGSNIIGQTVKEFDQLTLPAGAADPKTKDYTKTVTQKGKVMRTLYVSPAERSSLEVFGNYVDTLKAKGFTSVFECENKSCGATFLNLKYTANDPNKTVVSETADQRRTYLSSYMFAKVIDPRYALMKKGDAGNEIFVAVFAAQNAGGRFGDVSKALNKRVGVLIEVVVPGNREDKIVTLSADEIGSQIGTEGRAVLYGVLFDFDKATITPESAPQLDEMAAFLKSNADIKVYVVGHTDSKGGLDYNLKLSTARAKSVAAALAKSGIDAARLDAKGLGPLAPLASNQTEEGQAKNRRVELVPQ